VTTERLKATWRSPAYGFFRTKVRVGHENGRKYHYFQCAAKKCKGSGGVRRFQDSKDRAGTSNLRGHAVKCFGRDAVDAAFNNKSDTGNDGSIFAAFARQGQAPVAVSHRAPTTDETRYVFTSCLSIKSSDPFQGPYCTLVRGERSPTQDCRRS
jgi:hypothetical protein